MRWNISVKKKKKSVVPILVSFSFSSFNSGQFCLFLSRSRKKFQFNLIRTDNWVGQFGRERVITLFFFSLSLSLFFYSGTIWFATIQREFNVCLLKVKKGGRGGGLESNRSRFEFQNFTLCTFFFWEKSACGRRD